VIGLLAILFLAAAADPGRAEVLSVTITVAPDPSGALPDPAQLQAGVKKLFDSQLGSIVSLDVGGASTGGTPTASMPTGSSAQVSVQSAGDAVTVASDYSRAGSVRSLVSRVPRGSPASLLATISGDLAFLYFSARGFSTLPLSSPPALVGAVSTDSLAVLTGWNRQEMEPLGLTGHADEITICFPHRYLTLGPLFEVTSDTVRDLNAQSLAAEPLQLSGVTAAADGRLVLLSEQAARLLVVDPRLGTRTVVPAPGLSALPARSIGTGGVVSLPGSSGAAGPRVYSLTGGPARTLPVSASYLSAMDRDREGNLWVWDAGERRIRVITPAGREVFAVRPLLSASAMPLPQQMAVFDDGSFLLAGSAAVWKFQSSGIPVWRITRIPGRPGESLPPVFDLGADRIHGSFTILDQQSRRLLAFSPSPSAEDAPLAGLLARLDARKPADLGQASALARGRGLGVMAYGFADAAAASVGSERDRGPARLALLSEKAARFKELADDLARDLLLERADGAYLRAAEILRELSAEAPGDEAAAALLQDTLARRREGRAQLAGPKDVRIASAMLREEYGDSCTPIASLLVRLVNDSERDVSAVRVHVSIPSLGIAPALAALGSVAPFEVRDLAVPLGPVVNEGPVPAPALVYALVTYEQGAHGFSSAATFPAAAARAGAPGPAQALACRAAAQDTLASTLSESLRSGRRPPSPSALAELAGVLDSLEAARTLAASGDPAGPDASRPGPGGPASLRAALRGASPDEADWIVVTVSVASSMGFPSAVLSQGGRPYALVDTGVPFLGAFDAVPALEPFRRQLAAISPAGTLWVPFSGRVPPRTPHPAFWALVDALNALTGQDVKSGMRADLPSADPEKNSAVPFPLVVPALAVPMTLDDVAAAAGQAAVAGAAPDGPAAPPAPTPAPSQ
jgi:hypothetical protein